MTVSCDGNVVARGDLTGGAMRLALVIAGLVATQLFLLWPAFTGDKLYLPLDLLAMPGTYLPTSSALPSDVTQSDQVFHNEPVRRFMASEIRAGRWPVWCPYYYAGSPFVVLNWSPFQWLYVAWPDPQVLPWMQMSVAIVAGLGAYAFLRVVHGLAYWSATLASWCYPLTGFFVLWQGQAVPYSVAWLPWMLLATNRAVWAPGGLANIGLAVVSFATIASGTLDMAGEVLLVSGVYSLHGLYRKWRARGMSTAIMSSIGPVVGWGLGFVLAAGMLLPLASYLPTGIRMRDRASGAEERPPVGLSALPYVMLPEIEGSGRAGSFFLGKINAPESSASGYAGLIAALFLVPIALTRCRQSPEIGFWVVMAFVGLSWTLNVPGMVSLFRMPVLNMFSYNRLVFLTGWSTIVLSAYGLDCLWRGAVPRRWWFAAPIVVLLSLTAFCAYRSVQLPEPVATVLEASLKAGKTYPTVKHVSDISVIQQTFHNAYVRGVTTCALALFAWLIILLTRISSRRILMVVSTAMMFEMLRFAQPWTLMSDPALYYPDIPVLDKLAEAPAGRFLGVRCFPPCVAAHYQLRDVRGYDAVDPVGIVDLLDLAADPRFKQRTYARTQYFTPTLGKNDDGTYRLPGVLNMLNLRYLIFRGKPHDGQQVSFTAGNYWVWENPEALPRAFVPQQVAVSPKREELLSRIGDASFNAASLSYADVKSSYENCRGTAHISYEHPQEIVIDATMETAGLLVLSDLWYSGWTAEVNGMSAPIVHANYSLRGVELQPGPSKVVMRYQPVPLLWGLRISLAGLMVLWVWGAVAVVVAIRRQQFLSSPDKSPSEVQELAGNC